jgi:hypothetical protein
MSMLENICGAVPTRWRGLVAGGLSLAAGGLTALVLHYVLYRINMPSTPFIYVAF